MCVFMYVYIVQCVYASVCVCVCVCVCVMYVYVIIVHIGGETLGTCPLTLFLGGRQGPPHFFKGF